MKRSIILCVLLSCFGLANETNRNVWFDDLSVQITPSQASQENHYSPYGLNLAGIEKNGRLEHLWQYQGKEKYASLMYYDFGSRYYDPQLGKWHATDPQNQFASPYLALGNNPMNGIDPDGEFFGLLVAAVLLTTDLGYDIQKFVSPVAIHLDINIGTHQNGIGLDVSVGIPQAAPISYRVEAGATYFLNRYGGYGSGWQTRTGAEWGLGAGLIRYGGTRYRDFDRNGQLLVDQTVHRLTLGIPTMNIQYENDTEDSWPWARFVPFLPELSEGTIAQTDRYRTAFGRARFGPFELGFRLHTGEAQDTEIRGIDTNGNGSRDFINGNIDDPRRSNGIISFGFGMFRIGWDSEDIRHTLQNLFVHDWLSGGNNGQAYPWVLRTNRRQRFFFQFGGL